jgi:hypothetical protein
MTCQSCGKTAPTTYVAFYWNKGALIMRWYKYIKGEMCKSCIHQYFWEYTLINVTLGWWGVISLCVTPFFIINNVVRYIVAMVRLRNSAPAPAAPVPVRVPEPQFTATKFFLQIGSQQLPLEGGHYVELGGARLAEVNSNPNDPAMLGLKNVSATNWTATTPDGKLREVEVGRSIQLITGTRFQFGTAIGEIR